MSFRTWFKQWVKSFIRLLSYGIIRVPSEAEKKKEHERKIRAKHRGRLYPKKEKHHRQSSLSAQNHRLISAILNFVAVSLSILLVPFGLLDWGRKSAKKRKAARESEAKKRPTQKSFSTQREAPKTKKASEPKPMPPKTAARKTVRTSAAPQEKNGKPPARPASEQLLAYSAQRAEESEKARADTATNKNAPRSIPKRPTDRYVRRMIIEGVQTCDVAALEALSIGAYIDLTLEPDSPFGRDAVKLTYQGEGIGYLAKQDRLSFATCLRLGRETYGVITEIVKGDDGVKYECEAWLAGK